MTKKQELFEETEMKMDPDKTKLFFKHLLRNEEFKDIDIPHIKCLYFPS